ncbi:MAG: FlgK family flagellar hook-associated protein, partial [Planctomycetota bacterium]
MESAFGELSTDGLSTSIDEFFSAFQDLSIRPQDVNLQSSVLSSAESLTSQFRNLAK